MSEGFTNKVALNKHLKEVESGHQVRRREELPGRGNCKCKDLELGTCLVWKQGEHSGGSSIDLGAR